MEINVTSYIQVMAGIMFLLSVYSIFIAIQRRMIIPVLISLVLVWGYWAGSYAGYLW